MVESYAIGGKPYPKRMRFVCIRNYFPGDVDGSMFGANWDEG